MTEKDNFDGSAQADQFQGIESMIYVEIDRHTHVETLTTADLIILKFNPFLLSMEKRRRDKFLLQADKEFYYRSAVPDSFDSR